MNLELFLGVRLLVMLCGLFVLGKGKFVFFWLDELLVGVFGVVFFCSWCCFFLVVVWVVVFVVSWIWCLVVWF